MATNSAMEFMDSVLDLRVPIGGVENELSENVSSSKSSVPTAGSDTTAATGADGSSKPDPLTQLLTALSRSAMDQAPDDPLYLAYAKIMGKVNILSKFSYHINIPLFSSTFCYMYSLLAAKETMNKANVL